MEFRWNDWNLDHIAIHGVDPDEAEFIVRNARPPFPEERWDGRWAVWGRSHEGRFLQVSFVFDEDGTVYVIHARPLGEREKKRWRRRTRT